MVLHFMLREKDLAKNDEVSKSLSVALYPKCSSQHPLYYVQVDITNERKPSHPIASNVTNISQH